DGACRAYVARRWSHGSDSPSSSAGRCIAGSKEYATASRSSGRRPACSRHQAADRSGVSQAENGTGRLPCLRRLNRSSSAAAATVPSTTRAAAGSWKTALIPSTRMAAWYPKPSRLHGLRSGYAQVMPIPEDQQPLIATLKHVAYHLKEAGIPFALAGSFAVYARGGGPCDHDVDF